MTTTEQYSYSNDSFSGCDMVATIVYDWKTANYNEETKETKMQYNAHTLGEVQTISYSIHMEKRPVRSIGNVNAKDYVMGPRTIAGSLVFAVFNKHFAKKMIDSHNKQYGEGTAFLVDELPPFNIVISFANEYGLRSKLVIYGVRLLNEGQVMSVNDVYTENTYQFMATDIEYLNDDNKYVRNKYDKYSIVNSSANREYSLLKDNEIDVARVSSIESNDNLMEHISLSASIVDATKNNNNGYASLSLYPVQDEGKLTVTSSNNESQIITINGDQSYSIELKPDMYTAVFEKPNPNYWSCNSKDFMIKPYTDKYAKEKNVPIVEALTNTMIQLYCNEPTHNQVKITEVESNNTTYYNLKNRRVEITDLDNRKEYIISTCNGEDTISSPSIEIKTFDDFNKPFNDLCKMVVYNFQLLKYSDEQLYVDIIDEAKLTAINSSKYISPTTSIITLKEKYEKIYKNTTDEIEAANCAIKITICRELIDLSAKVMNNIICIINKNANVAMPKKHYNNNYNNVFEFSEDTTKAEWYRMQKNSSQLSESASSYSFKEIEGFSNSYSYSGKNGSNHFVQALRDNIRSPRLEYYELTNKEKQEMIIAEESKDVIGLNEQSKMYSIIHNEIRVSDSESLDRALIVRAKQLDNPILLSPNVISIKDNCIHIDTEISHILNENIDKEFYLCIANKEDILNNDFIYKCKIKPYNKEIQLEDVDYALIKDKIYATWIEDSNFNQLSNATSFIMSSEEDIKHDIIFEYEMQQIINEIKDRLATILPGSIYESLIAQIEYNEEVDKINVINKTLELLLYTGLGNTVIKQCLIAIKDLMGPMIMSDYILNDVKYHDRILSFKCNKEDSSIYIIACNDKEVFEHTLLCSGNNEIDLNSYDGDYLFAIVVSSDLKYKSDLIFINKNNNKMEVL